MVDRYSHLQPTSLEFGDVSESSGSEIDEGWRRTQKISAEMENKTQGDVLDTPETLKNDESDDSSLSFDAPLENPLEVELGPTMTAEYEEDGGQDSENAASFQEIYEDEFYDVSDEGERPALVIEDTKEGSQEYSSEGEIMDGLPEFLGFSTGGLEGTPEFPLSSTQEKGTKSESKSESPSEAVLEVEEECLKPLSGPIRIHEEVITAHFITPQPPGRVTYTQRNTDLDETFGYLVNEADTGTESSDSEGWTAVEVVNTSVPPRPLPMVRTPQILASQTLSVAPSIPTNSVGLMQHLCDVTPLTDTPMSPQRISLQLSLGNIINIPRQHQFSTFFLRVALLLEEKQIGNYIDLPLEPSESNQGKYNLTSIRKLIVHFPVCSPLMMRMDFTGDTKVLASTVLLLIDGTIVKKGHRHLQFFQRPSRYCELPKRTFQLFSKVREPSIDISLDFFPPKKIHKLLGLPDFTIAPSDIVEALILFRKIRQEASGSDSTTAQRVAMYAPIINSYDIARKATKKFKESIKKLPASKRTEDAVRLEIFRDVARNVSLEANSPFHTDQIHTLAPKSED